MVRIVYVNGSYAPYDEASVHVEDRGFQFADAVYEVCEVSGGRLVDERLHMERLRRSLSELKIGFSMSMRALGVILRETVRRNRVRDGSVYLQVSRGAAPRDFIFPAPAVAPTVICYAKARPSGKAERRAAKGIQVITRPDIRWRRPDIKSVSLLPNSLARQAASEVGADEAWLVDDAGFVTEGAASNAWIVTAEGTLVTRPANGGILRGITRTVLLGALAEAQVAFAERPFTVEEAKGAREAFVTAATSTVLAVIAIDGAVIGEGRPGPITMKLRALFRQAAEKSDPRILLA